MALLVALLVMALMGLAGIALVRAVDTATAVTGNLGFRAGAVAPSTAAIEDAWAALSEGGAIADPERDQPARGYYASRQPGEDARGVPLLLQGPVPGSGVRTLTTGGGNTVRYVIERLCTAPGPATSASCNLAVPYLPPPSEATPAGAAPPSPPPQYTVYRISARVEGPQQTVAHVQMMLRGSAPPRRLSWRVLDE
jgi:type IV pilus assembly protein PilX